MIVQCYLSGFKEGAVWFWPGLIAKWERNRGCTKREEMGRRTVIWVRLRPSLWLRGLKVLHRVYGAHLVKLADAMPLSTVSLLLSLP